MKNNAPIGVFDSGIGGLTVVRGLAAAFPKESIIYFGDTAHLPYGNKSPEAILEYSKEIVRFLLAQGCKLIVIACNSASASAYKSLKQNLGNKIPLVDVINPLVNQIAQQAFSKVGVIATKRTIRSDIYARKIAAQNPEVEVASLATALLANMIEEGFSNSSISQAIIHKYLSYPDFEDIEALLLACTHYPLIRKEIDNYFEGRVQVFDSVAPVVEQVRTLLQIHHLNSSTAQQPYYRFCVSDYTAQFEQTTRLFYGDSATLEQIKWDNGQLIHQDFEESLL